MNELNLYNWSTDPSLKNHPLILTLGIDLPRDFPYPDLLIEKMLLNLG